MREPAALHEAGVVGEFDLHLVVDASRVRADISSRSLASTGVDAARRPFRRPGAPRRPGRPVALPVRKAPGTRPCAQQLRTLLAEMPQSLATFAAEGYVMCISPSAKSNASPDYPASASARHRFGSTLKLTSATINESESSAGGTVWPSVARRMASSPCHARG